MDTQELAPRRPRTVDVAALIGLLSRLQSELMVLNDLDDSVPEWLKDSRLG